MYIDADDMLDYYSNLNKADPLFARPFGFYSGHIQVGLTERINLLERETIKHYKETTAKQLEEVKQLKKVMRSQLDNVLTDIIGKFASTDAEGGPRKLLFGSNRSNSMKLHSSINSLNGDDNDLDEDVEITAYHDMMPEKYVEPVVVSMLLDHHQTKAILNRRGNQYK